MKCTILIYLIGGVVLETMAARQISSSLDWMNQFNRRNTTENRQSCGSCNCGVPNTRRRIIGGQIAQEYMYPWMVLTRFKTDEGMKSCGGAMKNSRFVVTAAHCIASPIEQMSVVLRVYDLTDVNSDKIIFLKVEEVIIHPGWNPKTFQNDIALLKVDKEVEFTNKNDAYAIRPICMPTPDMAGTDYVGKEVVSIGWGDTSHGQNVPATKLKEAKMKIVEQKTCQQQFILRLTDGMMCAGAPDGSTGTCQGDSGGPLHYNANGVLELIGVVSWGGTGCSSYSVFARMDKYSKWVEDNSKDGCSCPRP